MLLNEIKLDIKTSIIPRTFAVQTLVYENITISPQTHDSIRKAFMSWITKDLLVDIGSDPTDSEIREYVDIKLGNYEYGLKMGKILSRRLQPILSKVVTSNKLPQFVGHTHTIYIRVDIYGDSHHHAAISANWDKDSKGKYTLDVNIVIPPYDVLQMLTSQTRSSGLFDKWTSNITHELTHIIQSLRNPKQEVRTKHPLSSANKDVLTRDDEYFMRPHEVDAFAQGTVSELLMRAKSTYPNDIPKQVEFLNSTLNLFIKNGMDKLFGRDTFPHQSYDKFKKYMKNHDYTNPNIIKAKKRTWRRYQSKIYQKLQATIDALQPKIK